MAHDKQAWVTYASEDQEGIKAIILGRSLRKTITRRKLFVVVAENLSKNILQILRDEFDSCLHVSNEECNKDFDGLPFAMVAKLQCWRLKRIHKFTFLDCNCMVLKNSDKIFESDAYGLLDNTWKTINASTFVGKTEAWTASEFQQHVKNLIQDKKDKVLKRTKTECLDDNDFCGLQLDYCVLVDYNKEFLITGEELKIVKFEKIHPLDLILKPNENTFENWKNFHKYIFNVCLELTPMDLCTSIETIETTLSIRENIIFPSITGETESEDMDYLKDSIAIVGMSVRFPGANSIDEFWDLLINGRDGIIRVPDWRWNKDQCFIRGDNTNETQAGFLKCPVNTFDAKFFGFNGAELEYMDPQQRLCLQVVWEGLQNAGICASELKETQTGVFGGWWRMDYKEMLQESGINEMEFFRAYLGNTLGAVTARISQFLELTGPSISTESGCSTSFVGIDMACSSLKEETCNVALAVGVNLLLNSFSIEAMNAVVSMDGHCKTFDAKADGFGRAEGCAVLVLKRFADAVSDGDKIWGVIRGSAVVQEGLSKSMGTPTVDGEALAMKLALERARVAPKYVSFVEAHGTGTPLGDPLEVTAIGQVYSKDRKDILTIGSVKTNVGHTESVAGMAGLVKTVLSLENKMIPKHLNLETLNPKINLAVIPAQIPLEAIPWKKVVGRPRIAGVSSFGITGTAVHAIIQESPTIYKYCFGVESRSVHVITISAKTLEALHLYVESYKTYFITTPDGLKDIEFSLNVKRDHFPYRLAIVGKTKEEIHKKLNQKAYELQQVSNTKPRLCFLFTGQGSQYIGMAKDLYDNSLVFKTHFDFCENLLSNTNGISIKHVMWESDTDALSRTLYSQTSIFVVEYCLLKLWESWGIKPDYVLGHSLGEFAAAVAAGILNIQDAMKLVVSRSKLIDSLPQGKMLVVKENLKTTERLLKEAFQGTERWLDIAAVNTQEQTVLAGETENVQAFADFCNIKSVKIHHLAATHAFHSRNMDPILDEYRTCVNKIVCMQNEFPKYISGMEGIIVDSKDIFADYWVRHTREKVNFMEASKVALQANNAIFLEIGPSPILSAMILSNTDLVENASTVYCMPSLKNKTFDWETILNSLASLHVKGFKVNWSNFHRYTNGKKVDLPSYPFQMKPYWMELSQNEGTPIHPLLGCPVPNPSAIKLFSSTINLEKLNYLKDHVIGNNILFPCAGYLELCLASGYYATHGIDENYIPSYSAMTVENFEIHAPLRLSETKSTQLQVVVSDEGSEGTKATIYSKLKINAESSNKWIKHASGIFQLMSSSWEGQAEFQKDNLESIKSRCTILLAENFSYQTIEKFGAHFGEKFQSLDEHFRGDGECLFTIKLPTGINRYVAHPVILDAIVQAVLYCLHEHSKELHVPISIQKCILTRKIETDNCKYIYCKNFSSKPNECTGILLDGEGNQLAVMVGIEFVETSVRNLTSLLDSQATPHPPMFQDSWKSTLGPFERRALTDEMHSFGLNVTNIIKHAEESHQFNTLSPEKKYLLNKSNRLCALYMIRTLHNLQVNLEMGETLDFDYLCTTCHVIPKLTEMLRYMIVELSKDDYFQIVSTDNNNIICEVKTYIPNLLEINKEIIRLISNLSKDNNIEVQCISSTGEVLADILTGKVSGLSILFPIENVPGPAEQYYKSSSIQTALREAVDFIAQNCFNFIRDNRKDPKTIIRVLEVGAGNSKSLLQDIISDGSSCYEYSYTETSQAFFPLSDKISQESNIKINYKVLNIDEDPTSQGFIPHYFDIIFVGPVLHAVTDIRRAVTNIMKLLSNDGLFMLVDLTVPHRSTNLIFGVLDGFWSFTDKELRPFNCELDVKNWQTLLEGLNVANVSTLNVFNFHCGLIYGDTFNPMKKSLALNNNCKNALLNTWIVFADDEYASVFYVNKLKELGKNVVVYNQSSINSINQYLKETCAELPLEGILFLWGLNYSKDGYQGICQPFLDVCKFLSNKDEIKLFLLTDHGINVEDDVKQNSVAISPIIGMAKVLQNENASLIVKCVDLDNQLDEMALNEGLSELFTKDREFIVVYRKRQRLLQRLVNWKPSNTALSFPKSDKFALILPPSLDIKDLRFGSLELPPLKKDDVEIAIKAYSLNFRDLCSIMKPDPVFENFNSVGIDYAGVVTAVGENAKAFKIGDAVCGLNLHSGSLPSHMQVKESVMFPIPEHMTYAEASTLPAVGITSYMCLIEIAKLKKSDTILIHAASGGVGIAAIQIAQSLGCRIIATVGRERKRNFLLRMGMQHVFYSRNTNYEHDIRTALGGNKVDVVLNSFTGKGFKEATLAVCNQNARFIEMSKMNIWTENEVKLLRPDVKYYIVDLSLLSDDETAIQTLHVKDLVSKAVLRPLPFINFDASEIRSAAIYFQKANHIGKVVCIMPDVSKSGEFKFPLFNDRCSYLITGGLGGIGLEVAKWMASSGAKYIILVGRSPPSEKAHQEIEKMLREHVHVKTFQCDIGIRQKCFDLLKQIKTNDFPPLRGIMHAAGVLSDGLFVNQTWESFERACHPKAKGAWNLHELTIQYQLDFFVMFSSMANNIGSIGQSNYVAANYFLDSLAQYRNSVGLPGLSINWGQWGQVGFAADLDLMGFQPFSIMQAFASLNRIMRSPETQITVAEADLNILLKRGSTAKLYLSELKAMNADDTLISSIDSDTFWKNYDEAITRDEKLKVVKIFICNLIRIKMKMNPDEVIDDNSNFQEQGMDSLLMIEMKNGLQNSVGRRVKITINSIRDCKTVAELSIRIVQLISGADEIPIPTKEQLIELILEDSILPENIKWNNGPILRPSDIRTVLIIGVTGNLGPYILRELSKKSQINKIYCLMRNSRSSLPKERLKQTLQHKQLLLNVEMDKVECFFGDITEQNFGMTDKLYMDLTENVDAIFNLCVSANISSYYCKTENKNSARVVNVLGTNQVLKFACDKKVKHVFHPSTILSTTKLDSDGCYSESWPIEGELDDQPNSAYSVSKFIQDRLIGEAVKRWIPCKVFRFPFMGGDSILGGNISVMNNHLIMRMMIYMQVGMMPARNRPIMIVPVDVCADLSIKIFFNDNTPYELYNISNPYVENELLLQNFAGDFGCSVEAVEPEMFFQKIENLDGEYATEIKAMTKMSRPEDVKQFEENPPPAIVAWLAGDKNVFLSKKLCKYIPDEYPHCMKPDWIILKKDLKFAKDSGIFEKSVLKKE